MAYNPNPVIVFLEDTYDFRRFALPVKDGIVISNLHNTTFQHQYKIMLLPDDSVPTQWGKKFSDSPVWEPLDGVKLLKENLSEKTIFLSQRLPLRRKGDGKDSRRMSKPGQQPNYSAIDAERFLKDIEKGLHGINDLLSCDDLLWWDSFFDKMRQVNATLFETDRHPVIPFVWRMTTPSIIAAVISSLQLDLGRIQERVYGPSRPIYVGAYQNERVRKERFK